MKETAPTCLPLGQAAHQTLSGVRICQANICRHSCSKAQHKLVKPHVSRLTTQLTHFSSSRAHQPKGSSHGPRATVAHPSIHPSKEEADTPAAADNKAPPHPSHILQSSNKTSPCQQPPGSASARARALGGAQARPPSTQSTVKLYGCCQVWVCAHQGNNTSYNYYKRQNDGQQNTWREA